MSSKKQNALSLANYLKKTGEATGKVFRYDKQYYIEHNNGTLYCFNVGFIIPKKIRKHLADLKEV